MKKEDLAELLTNTEWFKLYNTGLWANQPQLRYRGRCPYCDNKSSVYWRKQYGGWRCQKCRRTFTSREIPGLTELIYELLSL